MKRVVIIVIALLILLAIPVTVFLVGQRQELRKRAAPATTLSLSPASITKKVGETFSLEVKIDTGLNQVVATEIHLLFDADKLEAESITNGALFPNILTSGTVASGSASIAIGASNTTTPVTGTGVAAVIRFKALKTTDTPTSVRFDSLTFVGGLGEGSTNVLVGTTPARITITGQNDSNTPQPSPTPTVSDSNESTSSAVTITTPTKNTSVTTDQPTIAGKASPGSTVTITIYSDPITVTVKANSNGIWTYTPTTPLADGTHTIVASALDPSTGKTQTASTAFIVASGGSGSSSISATPVAGTTETTFILVSVGAFIFLTGFFFRSYDKLS